MYSTGIKHHQVNVKSPIGGQRQQIYIPGAQNKKITNTTQQNCLVSPSYQNYLDSEVATPHYRSPIGSS
jgi:hypothetical protein